MRHRLVLSSLAVVLVGWMLVSLVLSGSSWWAIKQRQWQVAAWSARLAQPFAWTVNTVSFHQVPEFVMWSAGLQLFGRGSELVATVSQWLAQVNQGQLLVPAFEFPPELATLAQACDQSSWMRHWKHCQILRIGLPWIENMPPALNWWSQGQKKMVIMLQNDDELRPTGGFMGSYVVLEFDRGLLVKQQVKDIYEPTGQFDSQIVAPAGVREYLSGGGGWQLPDSNWHPDVPTAAATILSFLSQGKETDVDLLVLVTSGFAEDILGVVGDIPLPDYGVVVTRDTVGDLARAQRQDFFPGSYQKPQFLSELLTQFKIKLAGSNFTQFGQLMQILTQSARQKSVLAFSPHPELQAWLSASRLTGSLPSRPLYVLEANVGINKINPAVTRAVRLDLGTITGQIGIEYHNQALNDEYINYLRLVVPSDWQLQSVSVDNQAVTDIDQHLGSTATGDTFLEVGWLVAVPPQSQQRLEATFFYAADAAREPLTLVKQPGLDAVEYIIDSAAVGGTLQLEADTAL